MSTFRVQLNELKKQLSEDFNVHKTPRNWTVDALIGFALADLALDKLGEPEGTKARLAVLRGFKEILNMRGKEGETQDMKRSFNMSTFGRILDDENDVSPGLQRCAICGAVQRRFTNA